MAFEIQSIIGRSSAQSFKSPTRREKSVTDHNVTHLHRESGSSTKTSRAYQIKSDPFSDKATATYNSIAMLNKPKPSDIIAGVDTFV